MTSNDLPTSIHELLERTEAAHGTKQYVYQIDGSVYRPASYNQFIADVRRVAMYLIDHGYKDKYIMLYGANSYEWLVSYVAICSYVGVCVCANKDWKEYDLLNAQKVVIPDVVLGDATLLDEFAKTNNKSVRISFDTLLQESKKETTSEGIKQHQRDKHAIMSVVFTTGTTSLPKAVPLTFANLTANVAALSRRTVPTSDDSYYLFLPLHHIYSQTCVALAALWYGSKLYFSRDVSNAKQELQLAKPTIIPGVPLFFDRIIDAISPVQRAQIGKVIAIVNFVHAPRHIRKVVFKKIHAALGGNIRVLISGAAKLDRNNKKLFIDMGFHIIEGYGMTEASGVVAAQFIGDDMIESSGKVLENIDIRIDGPDPDGVGEIYIKGENVMKGYLHGTTIDDDVLDGDGYYHTGDIGRIDAARNLFITGRKDKVIILASGESVQISEVSQLLLGITGIEKVYISQKNGYLAAELFTKMDQASVKAAIERLNATLPRYKQIHSFVIINEYAVSRMKQ